MAPHPPAGWVRPADKAAFFLSLSLSLIDPWNCNRT
jgi:hypothetical protein